MYSLRTNSDVGNTLCTLKYISENYDPLIYANNTGSVIATLRNTGLVLLLLSVYS